MGLGNHEFEHSIDKLLKSRGLRFHGIRLKCRKCGESALARTVSLAEVFGWMELKHIHGPDYEGLCITCAKPREIKSP